MNCAHAAKPGVSAGEAPGTSDAFNLHDPTGLCRRPQRRPFCIDRLGVEASVGEKSVEPPASVIGEGSGLRRWSRARFARIDLLEPIQTPRSVGPSYRDDATLDGRPVIAVLEDEDSWGALWQRPIIPQAQRFVAVDQARRLKPATAI